MLSDKSIREHIDRGLIDIDPEPDDHCFQPCSIDLRLSHDIMEFEVFDYQKLGYSTDFKPLLKRRIITNFLLYPGKMILGSTVEWVSLSSRVAARVEGKSTLSRMGILVHLTAGFIDPGFHGNITLEIANIGPVPIVFRAGMRICQVCFHEVHGDVLRPYGSPELKSKYQGDLGTKGAK